MDRLLAKDASERPATALEVAEALAPLAAGADLFLLASQLSVENTDMPLQTLAEPSAGNPGTEEYLSDSMTETHPSDLKSRHAQPSGFSHRQRVASDPSGEIAETVDLVPRAQQDNIARHPTSEPNARRAFPDRAPVRRGSHDPAESNDQRPPRSPRQIAIAAVGFAIIFLGVIIYVATNHGRLVIDAKADDVKVIVESAGGKVTIIDPTTERTVNLTPGEYDVRLEEEKAGLVLSTKSFTMRRGKEVVVEVSYEPKTAATKTSTPSTSAPQAVAATWPLGLAEKVMTGLIPRPASLPGIRRWQIETALPRSGIQSVDYSSDGQYIACGTQNGQVRVYDAGSLQLVRLFCLHAAKVTSVAWSPDGQWLASAGTDHTVRLWKKDGTPGSVLQQHRDAQGVCWSPDGKQLAVAVGSRGGVSLWNVDGTAAQVLEGDAHSAYAVAWSPDGKWIAAAAWDATVRLWKTDGTNTQVLKGHEHDRVNSVAWSPNSQTLASAGADGTVRLWSADGTAGRVLKASADYIHAVAWSPDGKSLAAASVGVLDVWNSTGETHRVLGRYHGLNGNVFSLSWSPDSQRIVTGIDSNAIHVWDATGQEKKPLSTIRGHWTSVQSVAFSSNGEQLASGGYDSNVRVWSADGHSHRAFEGHTRPVVAVAWKPDGHHVASASYDHTVRIWDKDGKEAAVLKHPDQAQGVAWSPDGIRIAVACHDRMAYLWDLEASLDFHTPN